MTDDRIGGLSEQQRQRFVDALADAGVDRPDPKIPVRRPRLDYRLSFAQERFWVLQQIEPSSAASHIAAPVVLRGALEIALLERAIQTVVDRHEALRTVFYPGPDGNGRQRILAYQYVPLDQYDLSHLATVEREAEEKRLIDEAANAPFNLKTGPLLRTALVRRRSDEHLLLISCHHIAADAWSVSVFMSEVAACYADNTQDRAAPEHLRELTVQYADYAEWERDQHEQGSWDPDLAYWRGRLAGVHPIPLAADEPVSSQEAASAHVVVTLSADTANAVTQLARTESASPFMIFTAATMTLLFRHGRWHNGDPVVGTPVAHRPAGELDPLIGCFLNTLVLRTKLDDDPPFAEALRRVRSTCLEAYSHQSPPYELVLQELRGKCGPVPTPIFPVMINMINIPGHRSAELPGITIETGVPQDVGTHFDLTLYINKAEPTKYAITATFDPHRRSAELITEIIRQIGRIIVAGYGTPHARLSHLDLNEPDYELASASYTAALPARANRTLVDVLLNTAESAPERTAVVGSRETYTYRQVAEYSRSLAVHLVQSGVSPGQVIVLRARRDAAIVPAIVGVLAARAICCVVDADRTPPDALSAKLTAVRPAAVVDMAGNIELPDSEVAPIVCQWPDERIDHAVDTSELPKPKPDDPAFALFTSGTTGRPSAVLSSHRAAVEFVEWSCTELNITERDRFSMLSGLAHDPLVRDIFVPLQQGSTIVIPPENAMTTFDGLAVWIRNAGVTVAHMTPQLGRIICEQADGIRYPFLRAIVFGGSATHPRDLISWRQLAPGATIINGYGTTETPQLAATFTIRPEDSIPGVIPVYSPETGNLGSVSVERQDGKPTPVAEPGEVVVRGERLAFGYLNDARLTADRFRPDPSGSPGSRQYRTGDVGIRLASGSVLICGRSDSQLDVNGERVERGEIEHAIFRLPEVSACAVTTREGSSGIQVVAHVVTERPEQLTLSSVRQRLDRWLPPAVQPTFLVHHPALPLTANGKIAYDDLERRDALEIAETPRSPTHPSTSEQHIIEEMTALLGKPVDVDMSFFDAGGNSLQAVQLAGRLGTPVRAIFDLSTPRGLAGLISPGDTRSQVRVPPRIAGQPVPLSSGQQRLWLLHQLDPESTAYNIVSRAVVRGPLSVEALERSLTTIVARHEVLRTTFDLNDSGQPIQRIHAPSIQQINYIDLTGQPDPTSQAQHISEENARYRFDLNTGPLHMTTLIKTGADTHLLLFTIHHSIADAWSITVLINELTTLYSHYLNHSTTEEPPLPKLPIQYGDYATWQQNLDITTDLDYWTTTLSELPTLNLPTDRPRTDGDPAGARHDFTLPAELITALTNLATNHDATLFMVLTAAFSAVLAHYTDSTDIPIGTPIANRTQPELDNLIGFFANTLVLRTHPQPTHTFIEHLNNTATTCLDAYAHQNAPFEQVVAAIAPTRDLTRNPLFQVMIALQNTPTAEPTLGEAHIETLPGLVPGAQFDLSLTISEEPDGNYRATLDYRTDAYDAASAAAISHHLAVVLNRVAADPNLTISTLASLSDEEIARQISPGLRARPLDEILPTYVATATLDLPTVLDRERLTDPPRRRATLGHSSRTCVGYVLDDQLRMRPAGAVGRLWFGGEAVQQLVAQLPERCLPDPYRSGGFMLRTDDAARLEGDGVVRYCGRFGDRLQVQRQTVYLYETAASLRAISGRMAVVEADYDTQPPRLRGYVAAPATDLDRLRERLARELPGLNMPDVLLSADIVLAKDDRVAITPHVAADARRTTPVTALETTVAGAWASVLGIEHCSREDNFFSLGGQSLTAVRMLAQLSRDIGIQVPLRTLFEAPTVAGFVRRVQQLRPASGDAIRARIAGQPVPLSSGQQRLWLLHQLDPESTAYNIPNPVELRGPLSVEALERSLTTIVARHEVLRTTFDLNDSGQPIQRIHAP
ncbi:MAG TPA: condensation domain-containing protein, partial [Nitrospira sp.]|nr:condensation domain-containing protein [Nitrospira sp.]